MLFYYNKFINFNLKIKTGERKKNRGSKIGPTDHKNAVIVVFLNMIDPDALADNLT